MAKENIEFRIGSRFDGEGFTKLDKALKTSSGKAGRLAATVGDVLVKTTDGLDGMSGSVGKLAKAAGPLLSGFLSMGVWGVVIGAVTSLIGLFKNLVSPVDEVTESFRKQQKELKSLDAMNRGYARRVEKMKEAKRERERAEEAAAEAEKKLEDNRRKGAEEAIKLEKDYYAVESQINQEKLKSQMLDEEGRKALETQVKLMKEAASEKVRQAEVDLKMANFKGSGNGIAMAQKNLDLAREQQKTVDRTATKMLKDYDRQLSEKVAAEKALADKQKAELAAKAKAAEAEKKIAAKKEEIAKRQGDQLKAIDAQIQAAKTAADALEENAKRARGVDFGQWARGERDLERDARREARQKKGREDRVQREIDRLEKMNPKLLTKGQRERLAKLREWQADQDPNNNPELKRLRQLEAERDKVRLDTLNELKMLRVDLNSMTI